MHRYEGRERNTKILIFYPKNLFPPSCLLAARLHKSKAKPNHSTESDYAKHRLTDTTKQNRKQWRSMTSLRAFHNHEAQNENANDQSFNYRHSKILEKELHIVKASLCRNASTKTKLQASSPPNFYTDHKSYLGTSSLALSCKLSPEQSSTYEEENERPTRYYTSMSIFNRHANISLRLNTRSYSATHFSFSHQRVATSIRLGTFSTAPDAK